MNELHFMPAHQVQTSLHLRSSISCVSVCEVHFENTKVPVGNVLGEVGGGLKVSCQQQPL